MQPARHFIVYTASRTCRNSQRNIQAFGHKQPTKEECLMFYYHHQATATTTIHTMITSNLT